MASDKDLQVELRRLRKNIEKLNKGEEGIYVPARLKELCKELGVSPSKSLDAVKTLAINLQDIVNPSDSQSCIVAIIESALPFVALAGPKGALAAYVLGILAHFIGKSREGPSLTKALNAALNQCRIGELKDRGHGVICQFSQNNIYMSATKTVDKDTFGTFDLYKDHGVQFLGELYSFIMRTSVEAKSEAEAHGVLELVQLFCQLTLARILMLHQLLELIRPYKPDYAHSIERILDALYNTSKLQLDFLSAPATNQVSVAALYIGREWPLMKGYLGLIGANSENRFDISSTPYTLNCGGGYYLQSDGQMTSGLASIFTIEKAEKSSYVIKPYISKHYFGEARAISGGSGGHVFASRDCETDLIIVITQGRKFFVSTRGKPCSLVAFRCADEGFLNTQLECPRFEQMYI